MQKKKCVSVYRFIDDDNDDDDDNGGSSGGGVRVTKIVLSSRLLSLLLKSPTIAVTVILLHRGR